MDELKALVADLTGAVNSLTDEVRVLRRRFHAVRWFSIVAILLALLAGYGDLHADQAVKKANHAIARAAATASCVNALLGRRAPTAAADSTANIAALKAQKAWADAIVGLFADKNLTPAQQQQVGKIFQATTIAYDDILTASLNTLNTDQQYRDQHPLGLC